MSEEVRGTKFLFNHKVDEHLEDIVAHSYKVTTANQSFPLDIVFDQSWKKALEIICDVEKQFFSELEPHTKTDYLNWIKSKRYSNLGIDKKHVDRVLNRGLRRSYEIQHDLQQKQQQLRALAEEQAQRERELREKQTTEFWAKCERELNNDYSKFETFQTEAEKLGIPISEFQDFRNNYVNSFLLNNCLGNLEQFRFSLDSEQLWAIGEPCNSTALIAARAGSGKTTVLALRALFLIKRFGVDPLGVVMLAFNRAAALELKSRIAQLLLASKNISLPVLDRKQNESESQFHKRMADELENLLHINGQHLPLVTTFHAIGRGIVFGAANSESQYAAQIVTDEDDERTLQTDCVNEAIERVFSRGSEINYRQLMLEHFQTDWMEILRLQTVGNNPLLAAEYERYPRDTLRGHSVRSHGEKTIADFLFKRGIDYRYEKPVARDNTVTFPDFVIDGTNNAPLIIEYFGIVGVDSYSREAKRKITKHKIDGVPILGIHPAEISSGAYVNKILDFLIENQYSSDAVAELSEEDLWEKLQVRGRNSFNASVNSFISRASQRNLSPGTIQQGLPLSLTGVELTGTVLQFSQLATEIFKEYLAVLKEKNKTDFNQVLQNATKLLKQGVRIIFPPERQRDLGHTTHVIVDEFQDFSPLFQDLVDQLLAAGDGKVSLTAVGDSWQSINSFMGSDERIIDSFAVDYPYSRRLTLLNNYRSNAGIVAMGNAVMSGVHGEPSVPVRKEEAFIGLFSNEDCKVTQEELDVLGSQSLALLVRLIGLALENFKEVVVLVRFNKMSFGPEQDFSTQVRLVKNKLSRVFGSELTAKVDFSTVHSFKGKEKEAVILWDANDAVYPFVHSNSFFDSYFGSDRESIVREERRLFYVGVTRAKSMLLVNTDENPSPFLKATHVQRLGWPNSPVNKSTLVERTLFQIFLSGNSREDELRSVMKRRGFRFISTTNQYWESEMFDHSSDLNHIPTDLWIRTVWEQLLPGAAPTPGIRIRLIYQGQTVEYQASTVR